MPLILSDESKTSVSDHLKEIGCCKFCVLRFLGERYYKTYHEPTLAEDLNEPVDQDLSEEPAVKRPKLGSTNSSKDEQNHVFTEKNGEAETGDAKSAGRPQENGQNTTCIACYSLLEPKHLKESLRQMVIGVKKSQCVFDSFKFLLSVPVALELRHHAMLLHLKSKFGELYSEVSESDLLSVKEVWKNLVGSPFSKHFSATFDTSSSFQVSITLPSPSAEAECAFLLEAYPGSFPNRKQRKSQCREVFTRHAVSDALRRMPDGDFTKLYPCPPSRPEPLPLETEVTCVHMPVYLAGRYCKYSRLLSQTPWILNDKRIMETSVQELITEAVIRHIPNSRIVFSSSGREDVDVRMLGKGRPFILEIFEPKRATFTKSEMESIEKEINEATKDIKVNDLQVISKSDTQVLKDGEESKRKCYTALCCANRPLTAEDSATVLKIKDLVLKQKTPIRVLHRRNLAERERIVYDMSLEPLEGNKFVLKMTTQAGTYVKEFVHGDFGRTTPSLGDYLNAEVDIVELDVEEIDLDWPPPRK
ncbi:tRNA pseudouridine synthase Pus10 [Ixodes scapularis]|uniref:tRNA pseudouridine synthase Pus10 n=1 Tax=Ixodes scapularis TaxID=6945 RepID=UPI001A9E1F53|nr:tRNA pseudouridine synthase Pus10 [Ixodes scapularis]